MREETILILQLTMEYSSLHLRLTLGNLYSKNDLADILNEPNLKLVREGIYSSTTCNTVLLFVDLVKTGKEERFHFNDYFQEDYFHWDSQTTQNINSPRIQKIVNGDVEVTLFVRITSRIKSAVQPFVYCGRLEYLEHDPNTRNPVHVIFNSIDYNEHDQGSALLNVYSWKPEDIGKTSSHDFQFIPKGESKLRVHKKPNYTERKGLVTSRVGQGYYRQEILKKWEGKCSLTNCQISEILISSHIKSWRDSNDAERLDPDNGILFSPSVDSLFDKHLISFEDDGSMVLSSKINETDLNALGLNSSMKIKVTQGMKKFLSYHRSKLV
jgi:hypothetical protein